MLLRACLSWRMGSELSMADGNITVEVITQAAQAELERLRAENAALKHDLQYARDGLTKGRTRMREDNERLRAALVKIEAGCCIDPRQGRPFERRVSRLPATKPGRTKEPTT